MLATKGYIYTVPKAGTYLMNEYLGRLGSVSTGWHIEIYDYLDTLKFDADTNRTKPSLTNVSRNYIASLTAVPKGHHALGHLSPMFVPPMVLRRGPFKCLCVRRHPREVLVSEFIDFRFRRSDVDFVSRERVSDTHEAFELHLRKHGPITASICREFALLERLLQDPLYVALVGADNFYFLNMRDFLHPDIGVQKAMEISEFFGFSKPLADVVAARRQSLDADNKTKSAGVDLDVVREELWTPRCHEIYRDLGFETFDHMFE